MRHSRARMKGATAAKAPHAYVAARMHTSNPCPAVTRQAGLMPGHLKHMIGQVEEGMSAAATEVGLDR